MINTARIIRLFRPAEPAVFQGGDEFGYFIPEPEPPLSHAAERLAQNEIVLKQLEDDVVLTMEVIRESSVEVRSRVDHCIAVGSKIAEASQDLWFRAGTATDIGTSLASTSKNIDRISHEIEAKIAGTDQFMREARTGADHVTNRMNTLADEVATISSFASVIGSIAKQTNLLALNATIEAARAGPAGRGFAVVAMEVKSLSMQAQKATGDIARQIASLRALAAENQLAVDKITNLIKDVEPVLGSMRGAVKAQIESLRDMHGRIEEGAEFADLVAEQAEAVQILATDVVSASKAASVAGMNMEVTLERFTERSVLAFRAAVGGDRRRKGRFPTCIPGSFESGGRRFGVTTLDISEGGVCLDISSSGASAVGTTYLETVDRNKLPFKEGDTGLLTLERIGEVKASVLSVSQLGVHVRFQDIRAETTACVTNEIDGVLKRNEKLIATVQQGALEISTEFQNALTAGSVRHDALFSSKYKPIPGTHPKQYETEALWLYEKVLPTILEKYRSNIGNALFVIATDRNSYLPVHQPEYSQPQVEGKPEWNDVNSRNKRILDRWMSIIISRNKLPFLMRGYVRHMADGTSVPAQVIAAPIQIQGSLWGNFQIAIPLK